MTTQNQSRDLAQIAPELDRILTRRAGDPRTPSLFEESQIRRETVWVTMRDGVRLATDLYLPPTLPAPTTAMRTPYGRTDQRLEIVMLAFARQGYVVIAQDVRGTGDSEPDVWEYYMSEPEDGVDFVEWVTQQEWFNGFLFSFGTSYASATQWCMAAHPRMSAIVPEVGGLQTTRSTVRPYMFVNGYSRAVGKGANRLRVSFTEIERLIEDETMAGGYFNEPLHRDCPSALLDHYPDLRALRPADAKRALWVEYCALSSRERVEFMKQLFGVSQFTYGEMCSVRSAFDGQVTCGSHTIPSVDTVELCQRFRAPALVVTGWFDWNLGDMLPSWAVLRGSAREEVASRSRLIITPSAHNMPGYHEGEVDHPELQYNHRYNVDLLLRWYEAVRNGTIDAWPTVIYYLMGANKWSVADGWPVPEARLLVLYLGSGGTLASDPPSRPSAPDRYTYDPSNPTPTVGGSIVSFIYRPGSADVAEVQQRPDVLTYTTALLDQDLDVVGPLKLILYASSSAVDTDFSARISDVFPDGRAIQLQSGMLRARFRSGDPALLEPGRVYRLEIDLWAIANRFKKGHRLRIDISSSDFPRFDRNANRGGEPGPPVRALQSIYHDPQGPSHLVMSVLACAGEM